MCGMKVEFIDSLEWNNTQAEVMDFPDDITDKEIQAEYEMWVWERIGDNFGWTKIKEEGE